MDPSLMRLIALIALIGLIGGLLSACASTPSSNPAVTETVTVTATPTIRASSETAARQVMTTVPLFGPFETLTQAKARLAAAGLRLGTITYEQSSMPPDLVDNPVPASGTLVPRGSAVSLGVSYYAQGGNSPVYVPNVLGLGEPAARSMLAMRPLKVVEVSQHNTSIKAGDVLKQSPAPNTHVAANSTVTIWVANPN